MNKLAIKSILGFLNLFFLMGVAIFLPAGTLYFKLGWYYLLLFFGGVSVITVYIFLYDKPLLQSRLKVGTIAEPRTIQKVIQGFASLGFIGMYILSGFDHRMHWSEIPDWLWISADFLLILTMADLFLIFKMNSFLSATIEIQRQQAIVTEGPYAIVRHPMYAAAMILFLCTPLALGSYWALITFPFMLIVLVFRCLDEEKVLSSELVGYEDYCNKTKYRLIPYIW